MTETAATSHWPWIEIGVEYVDGEMKYYKSIDGGPRIYQYGSVHSIPSEPGGIDRETPIMWRNTK